MAQELGTGKREGYATELAGLWSGIARTLRRLDEIADAPERTLAGDGAVDELARLRYALHVGSERILGLRPPPGVEASHDELAEALAGARDATADVAELVALAGPEAARMRLHEWRGALFRVRLAQRRLARPRQARATAAEEERSPHRVLVPAIAVTLTVVGAATFALGATFAAWPIWLAGMLAVVAGLLVYRP